MKKTLLIFCAICTSYLAICQSPVHNKLTLEIGTNLDLVDVANNVMDELFDGGGNTTWVKENPQSFELVFAAQYRIARKLSFEIGTSTKKYEYEYNYDYYDDNRGDYISGKLPYGVKKSSISLGLNIFLGKSLAPLGMHIGFFYKYHKFKVRDIKEHYAVLNLTEIPPAITTDKTPHFNFHNIGIKIGSVSAISKKRRIFFKYGFSFSVPIKESVSDKNYSPDNFPIFVNWVPGQYQTGFIRAIRSKDYANFYFGLGYMF